MEIKKADSKGRVSGFEPTTFYRVETDKYGTITLTPVKYYTEAELQLLPPETGTNATLAGMTWDIRETDEGLEVIPAASISPRHEDGGTVPLKNPVIGFPVYEKAVRGNNDKRRA